MEASTSLSKELFLSDTGTVSSTVFVLRPLPAAALDDAAALLAAAFADYPWTRWAVPAQDYTDRLTRLQRLYLQYAREHGIVLADADVTGVVALLPPNPPEPPSEMQDEVAALHGDRLDAVAGAVTPPPPTGAWTLETLGVDPRRRGRGLGASLVRAALDAVPAGVPVALDTSDPRNVRLYERCDFGVTATTLVPDGPTVVSMVHPAAT
ncbi:GNAT family N-acetyltransferase [Rhodococcus corynebacterioides]|uniref:GNAT family N-acetyltransferase n=1 Tax=Rhodococcoides corynebacterioides TaxID=53972 RepID=A0ABS7P1P0_9NOCA|nr:GNAT family N-acetyltransferase [Rhodococcus corynebacterioides]MBY6406335.1 GNAT family N-acetyltransferase [Rhodococcus corynebacterioides]